MGPGVGRGQLPTRPRNLGEKQSFSTEKKQPQPGSGSAVIIPAGVKGGEEPREKSNLCREALLRMRMLRRREDRKAPGGPGSGPC